MTQIALGSLQQNTVTIPSGTKISNTISTGGSSLSGISLPAVMTSATLSFLSSPTGTPGSFQPVSSASGVVSYPISANGYVAINPQDFYGILFLQIQSNANEAADRQLICSMKGI